MYVGADYYPEHWPRDRWETDARLMQEAGFNIVRLAEFAWINMEPTEGQYEFGWLDEALGVLADRGISVILGTPTAVMPAWVARKYPETLAMQANGQRITWGVRKDNCFTSGAFRLLSERITRAMAEHCTGAANVIGWQTDNEFSGPQCFCPTCRADFQDWLRQRYGTLDELNRAWGTHFWGHKFGTWGEIVIPDNPGGHNPSALLDWHRYNSWLNVRFQADQIGILRQVCPQHFITHNFMGTWATDINYYDLARDLDFVSWDNYPISGPPDIPYSASAAADLMRGLKGQNFWIMEQTAGCTGWGEFSRNPRPGEIRRVAYQQLAHGADAQIWFRWRTCTAGREQYWHGLLQHDGEPRRRYKEAARVATEYHKLADELAGTTVHADVAFIWDYDSIWALQGQPCFGGNNYQAQVHRYYNALMRARVNADFIAPDADFSAYKIVIAPELHILPDARAQALSDFVGHGGVLLADLRLGVKDETNLCHPRTLPGLLSETLGIAIEEYEALVGGMEYLIQGQGTQASEFHATLYADWITPTTAQTLVGYRQIHMDAFAAMTRNEFGQGMAYYVGTVVREDAFYDTLIGEILARAGVTAAVVPPAGVEVSVRTDGEKKIVFLINHTEEAKAVGVPARSADLLADTLTGSVIGLEPFGVAVLKM